jgi:hypothetical protein
MRKWCETLIRRFDFGILVNSPPGFPPQPSGLDVLHQERRGAIFVPERFLEIFQNAEPRVEPY